MQRNLFLNQKIRNLCFNYLLHVKQGFLTRMPWGHAVWDARYFIHYNYYPKILIVLENNRNRRDHSFFDGLAETFIVFFLFSSLIMFMNTFKKIH